MQFNTRQFNTGLFNGGVTNNAVYLTDTLVFDGFSLSDGSVMIMTDLRFLGPTRELVGGPVPRGDGEYLTNTPFREYVIEAEGIVKKSTAALLDAHLDTVRKGLRRREQALDYTDAGGTVKRFTATCDNFEELFSGRERYHVTFCPWKARFRCKTPFGKARDYTSTTLTITASPTTHTVIHEGTWEAQPVITLIFDSASSVTALTVTNVSTGESISYSGAIAANDVIQIDGERKTFTKNSAAVDFTGSFPTLDVTTNAMKFEVTGTSYSAVTTISHKATYL